MVNNLNIATFQLQRQDPLARHPTPIRVRTCVTQIINIERHADAISVDLTRNYGYAPNGIDAWPRVVAWPPMLIDIGLKTFAQRGLAVPALSSRRASPPQKMRRWRHERRPRKYRPKQSINRRYGLAPLRPPVKRKLMTERGDFEL